MSVGKKRQTFEKGVRERAVKERRALKLENKRQRRLVRAAEAIREESGAATP